MRLAELVTWWHFAVALYWTLGTPVRLPSLHLKPSRVRPQVPPGPPFWCRQSWYALITFSALVQPTPWTFSEVTYDAPSCCCLPLMSHGEKLEA